MDIAPVKLQDFAKQNGVTDRAIQKHLKKHEAELEGHFWRKGPNGTWLDEFAQMYIKNLLREQPMVVYEHNEKIELLEQENKMLLKALNEAKDKVIELTEINSQLNLKAAETARLEADNEAQKVKVAEAEKNAQKAQEELTEAQKKFKDEKCFLQNELQAEKTRKLTLRERLLGRKIEEQIDG